MRVLKYIIPSIGALILASLLYVHGRYPYRLVPEIPKSIEIVAKTARPHPKIKEYKIIGKEDLQRFTEASGYAWKSLTKPNLLIGRPSWNVTITYPDGRVAVHLINPWGLDLYSLPSGSLLAYLKENYS